MPLIRLGIVAALPAEARCLAGRVSPGERAALGSEGWVQLSGMGRRNAGHAAASLLQSGAGALLSWGIAAGLDPQLRHGTLVLPKAVIALGGRTLAVDAAWHERIYASAAGLFDTSTGNLAESAVLLTSLTEKQALFRRTGAATADMESAAVGETAREAGVPFMVVRAVLDPADRALPSSAVAAMDESGRFQLLRLLKILFRRPTEFAGLFPLGIGLLAARTTLAKVAKLSGPRLLVRPEPA